MVSFPPNPAMTSGPDVPVRVSSPVVPTIVAACPKQVWSDAADAVVGTDRVSTAPHASAVTPEKMCMGLLAE